MTAATESTASTERLGALRQDAVLDVRDLRMRYGTADVLIGVTFAAHRGEVLALLGPNGAGKPSNRS